MRSAAAEDRSFAPVERAATYRDHAAAMLKCAARARTEDEQLEYFRLAKAWLALAEGLDLGLTTVEACTDPGPEFVMKPRLTR
jgi:hypothetical protein